MIDRFFHNIINNDLSTLSTTAFAATLATTTTAATTTALTATAFTTAGAGSGSVGCETSVRAQILLAVLLAVADPDLDTHGTHLGVGYGQSVVDVCAEGVQRGAAFLEHLTTGR